MSRTYVPKKVAPLNIDLYGYRKPKADRSILKFSYFYLALAIICIICVLLQYKVEEFHKYNILIEAMADQMSGSANRRQTVAMMYWKVCRSDARFQLSRCRDGLPDVRSCYCLMFCRSAGGQIFLPVVKIFDR